MTGAVISIAIVLIVVGGAAAIVVGYFQLQRHRTDAVAMDGYRRLAEEVAAAQTGVLGSLRALDGRLDEIENLLRVGS